MGTKGMVVFARCSVPWIGARQVCSLPLRIILVLSKLFPGWKSSRGHRIEASDNANQRSSPRNEERYKNLPGTTVSYECFQMCRDANLTFFCCCIFRISTMSSIDPLTGDSLKGYIANVPRWASNTLLSFFARVGLSFGCICSL